MIINSENDESGIEMIENNANINTNIEKNLDDIPEEIF